MRFSVICIKIMAQSNYIDFIFHIMSSDLHCDDSMQCSAFVMSPLDFSHYNIEMYSNTFHIHINLCALV